MLSFSYFIEHSLVDFPGTEEAMKASIALSRLTDISFSTFPAVSVEKFDEMVREL